MDMNNKVTAPVGVVSMGPSEAAETLRLLIDGPVVMVSPYDLAMGRVRGEELRALVVENFHPQREEGLSEYGAARWAGRGRPPLTVISLDDPAGRRLAGGRDRRVFTYSDGCTRADLTAKNVNLRREGLEFEALIDGDMARIYLPGERGLYGTLAALACALGLGMPLGHAAERLRGRRHRG